MDAEIDRVPVGEIVPDRDGLTEEDVDILPVGERDTFAEGEPDADRVVRTDTDPEKVPFAVGEPDAEIEVERVDVLDAVSVEDTEFVLDVDTDTEVDLVPELDLVIVPEDVVEGVCRGVAVPTAEGWDVRLPDAVPEEVLERRGELELDTVLV